MLTDICGTEIEVGDEVAYNPPYYKGIVLGTVRKLSKYGATVEEIGKSHWNSEKAVNRNAKDIVVTRKWHKEIN